jgi:hypothetical protein
MPRCFAVVERYVLHNATVPTYATWESTSPEPCKWCFSPDWNVAADSRKL